MAWFYLFAAGLLEIVWAIALKQADGFSRLGLSVVGVSAALASLLLLTLALRSLPVGTAYAIWVGIGTVGVALAGIILLDEPVSAARVAFLTLIVVGVAGFKAVEA